MRYVRLEGRENTGHVAAREVRRHDPFFVWGTGVRGGQPMGCEVGCGSRWDGSRWERFEAACGSGRAVAGQRSTRSALRSRRQERLRMRGWGSSCLRIGSALRSLPAVRRLLMGREMGAVRGGSGSRLSVARSGQSPGSGRLASRCALVGKKGWDARMGLVVPPNRLRAALAARCPSAADGVRGGSVRGGLGFEVGRSRDWGERRSGGRRVTAVGRRGGGR